MVKKIVALSHIFVILLLIGCSSNTVTQEILEGHMIVKVWKKEPVGIHEEVSPKYRAILSNGDTVPCSKYAHVGDSVYYRRIIKKTAE
jgi:hypothetical protein